MRSHYRFLLLAVGLLAFAAPVFAASHHLETLNNIDAAEASGLISHDDAALNVIYTMFDRELVDARFLVAGEQPLKCGTHLIHELRNDETLSDTVQATLDGYLAAPLGDRDIYISPGGIFQITYSIGGASGVSATDTDPANGIPDFIDNIAEYLDYSWQVEITDAGFTAPGLISNRYFITITNLSGVYGFTQQYAGTTRITLDNDYSGFPSNDDPDGNALGAAKVTCAHEFKHASQYTCSNWSEGGWVELDATWAEELVYPATNDYHNYVAGSGSPLRTPQQSLDSGGSGSYEDSIWQAMMADKWGVQMIVELWELRDANPAWPMMTSYDNILQTYGSDRASFMAEWTRWNYLTGYKSHADWDGGPGEGGYPDSPDLYSCVAWYTVSGLGNQQTITCEDMGSRYARHMAVSGLADFPKITFNGDDSQDFRPQVIVKKTDGTLMFDAVPVDSNADGELVLSIPFSLISELAVSFPNCTLAGGYKNFTYQLVSEQVTDADGPLGAATMKLHAVYPNPFNPKTSVRFELAEASPVQLSVVNASGRVLRTLSNGEIYGAGDHVVSFDGKDDAGNSMASGVYFAMLSVGGSESQLSKMTLLK
jgi:hypothetical protein